MKPYIIGIAGGSGSGKTTLADRLCSHFGTRIARIAYDNYYRAQDDIPLCERQKTNYDHPEALETELLISHLDALVRGECAELPTYDFANHTRARKTEILSPRPIILVEGILLFCDTALRDRLGLRIFVDTDADIRLARRIRRDVEERGRTLSSVLLQYEQSVKPMHEAFVEPSKRHAHIIVPEGGHNECAYRAIAHAIEDILTQSEKEHT